MKVKVSPDQRSLFELLDQEDFAEPKEPEGYLDLRPSGVEVPSIIGAAPHEFIIWYANMGGHGEYIYSRFANSEQEFAPRKMILDGNAEPILFDSVEAEVVREKRHARLGVMIWHGESYQIEEIWGQALADLYAKP